MSEYQTGASQYSRSAGAASRPGRIDVLSLAPLLALTRDLSALLAPVRPRPAFKEALEASLLAAARQRNALDVLDISVPAAPWAFQGRTVDWRGLVAAGRERRWVVGAAVGSAVSVASLVAYLWRQRSQRAA